MTLLQSASATVFRVPACAYSQPQRPGLQRLDKGDLTAHAVPSDVSEVGTRIKVEVYIYIYIGGGRSGFANKIGYYAAFSILLMGVYS